MAADGAALVARYRRLQGERALFDQHWEQLAPLLAPSRVGIRQAQPPGTRQTQALYDSTTLLAAELMAQFIAGHLINPGQRWFSLGMDQAFARSQGRRYVAGLAYASMPVREWCEEMRDRQLARYAASAFYAEGPESLIDYGGFGTGCLLGEERPQPVNQVLRGFRGFYFSAEKTGRFVIAEDAAGMVDTLMREYRLTARACRDRWGAARLPEALASAAETRPDQLVPILHVIDPRPTAERAAGARGMPWRSVWVTLEGKDVLSEGGYPAFPACVPRYQKTPGEVYGRGRGDLAFPDTWTLNTAKRMGLEDWALKIRPPVLVASDSVIGSLRLTPGAPTTVNLRLGRGIQDSIRPFETGSHPEISQLKEEELRKSIRQIFYVDAILQLLQVEKSEMTAFEFAKKIELLFRLLGPVYGRMEFEFLRRRVEADWDTLWAAGEFPPPPPEVLATDGAIDVEFQNPLAKAQRSGDAESLTLALNDLAPLGSVAPQLLGAALDRLHPDKTSDGVFAIRGVPAAWQRSDAEMQALRDARHQQNQDALDAQQADAVAGALGKAAPMVKALKPAEGAGA